MSAQGKPVCSSDLLLQLQEEIKKGNGGNDYSRFLERKIAELELKEEVGREPHPIPATVARLERRVVELELKEEEGRKPHPNPATVARLERRIAELNLMRDKIMSRTTAPMSLIASSVLEQDRSSLGRWSFSCMPFLSLWAATYSSERKNQ